ncbi:MAG: M1 family metallopeptidase [Acidobacteriota bacterium]
MRSVFAALVLAAVCLLPSCRASAQRLPTDVVPTHYTLTLTPDLKTATFTGVEKIDVNLKQPSKTITLNAAELKFQSVVVYPNGPRETGSVSLDPAKEQATFTFPNAIPAGSATLEIHYTGILNNELRGFYLSHGDRRNYAVTQFEPTDARRAFPSFDEPAYKARFSISLVVDQGDTAISNGAIVADTPGPGPDKHTLEFSETPKMSTYLVAFLVGDFQCTAGSSDGVAIRVCATPDKVAYTSYPLSIAEWVLHYYDDYFGIHYPLKKLDLIAIPDFEAGAMENFGAITYRETDLLVDAKTASLAAKKNVAIVVAHEMAHQWFGDLVTMAWWNNIWLNEGFATWMETKAIAAMHPEWHMDQMEAAADQQTLNVDALPTTRAIRAPEVNTPAEINQLFDAISYGKAGAVLRMVENYEGKETFRKGVHAYLTAHEYANATAQDFWSAQTTASGKPIDKVMESMVVQPGVPMLSFSAPRGGQVQVQQQRFFLNGGTPEASQQKWTLPVCFQTAGGSQDCQLLTPSTTSLKAPAGPLFFANAEAKGYYRSAYAPAQYKAIVAAVETRLTPVERISFAGDEWARVRANQSSVGDFLNLAAALKADPYPGVLSQVSAAFSSVYYQVAATQQQRQQLQKWVHDTFGPEYKKLGAPSASDSADKRELRATLFRILGYYGNDPAVLEQAKQLSDEYLADPASVNPSLAQTALAVAAQNGDEELFNKLQNVYETAKNPELQENALRYLAMFANPELEKRALAYDVSGKVRNQDAAIQFAISLQIPETRQLAWSFIKDNWQQVQGELTTSMGQILVGSTGAFCSAEARNDVQSFFATHKVEASETPLKQAVESINGCIALRAAQEPKLKSWLSQQPGLEAAE